MQTYSAVLRPLGMGELLDRAIRLYRRNFWKFIGVIGLIQVPLAAFNLAVNLLTTESIVESIPDPTRVPPGTNPFELLGPGYYTGVITGLLLGLLHLIMVNGIASAALTRMVADSYLGEQTEVIAAYRAIGDRWGPLVAAIFLYIGLTLMILFWTLIPCAGWLTGPGMLLVLAGMVLPLVAPVVVMEKFGARGSLRRTWELIRPRFWWIFAFMLLLFLFNWVVVGGPSLLSGIFLELVLPESLGDSPAGLLAVQTAIQSIVGMVFNLLYLPLQLACLTLLYFDLRVRSEGLDLLLTAGSEQESGIPVRDLIARTPPLPASGPVAGREMVNFFLLTILILGVYLAIVAGIAALLLLSGQV